MELQGRVLNFFISLFLCNVLGVPTDWYPRRGGSVVSLVFSVIARGDTHCADKNLKGSLLCRREIT